MEATASTRTVLMTRKNIGAVLMGLGGLLAVVGLIGIIGSGGSTPTTGPLAAETTSTTGVTTTSTVATTTTTALETTTTTTAGTTTTTDPVFDEVAAIEAFIPMFIAAIESGDSEFLYDRLHPAVKAEFDEQLCRDFINREILSLENYVVTGPITGPNDAEFQGFQITSYDAPVSFTFQGAEFDSTSSYALTEGTVRWFAVCR